MLQRTGWRLKWAGWEWMEVSERFTNTQFYYAYKKPCSTVKWPYLSCHSSSWFSWKWPSSQIRQYKEIALLGPHTPPQFRECSYKSLFLFFTPATIKALCNRKRNFVLPLIFIGHSLALNSLSNHLKVTFEQILYWYAYAISYTLVQ